MNPEDLADLPIFRGLDEQQCGELLSIATKVEFGPGEKIITQGKNVPNLWFILAGKCIVNRRTEDGCQLKLAELGPHTQFGEMSFFHPAPHSADVVAESQMQLLQISREDYDRLLKAKNPIAYQLAFNCLEILAVRLRLTDEWITDLVCKDNHTPTPSEWTSFRELLFRTD